MILVGFLMFAVLIVAWLMAPNGEVKSVAIESPIPAPAPALKLSETPA